MFKYVATFLLLLPTAAFADKIDGSWCSANARVDINGPHISLGGKPAFDGQYARHEFRYTVPEGEAHAGDQIYLRLRGEEDMTSFTIKDGNAVDPIDWKRCKETS